MELSTSVFIGSKHLKYKRKYIRRFMSKKTSEFEAISSDNAFVDQGGVEIRYGMENVTWAKRERLP